MTKKKIIKPIVRRVARAVAHDYHLRFVTETSLAPADEEDPITEIDAEIIYQPDRNEDEPQVVGHLYGWVIRIHRVLNDNYSFIQACDAHSQDLYDVGSTVWVEKGLPGFREDICEGIGDLIVPGTISIAPQHRGKDVGLLAMWRFLDYFGGGAALAVVKPFPLNHCGGAREPEIVEEADYTQFVDVSLAQGKKKLAAHWARLGFAPIPNSDYYFIDMACHRPSLEDLVEDWPTHKPGQKVKA